MRKYYKLDEEPSPEVQAKVFVDLRIHDMEYKNILEKIEECKRSLHYLYPTTGLHPYFY